VMTTKGNEIEMIKGTPVFRLRDHLLPLVSLPDVLKLKCPKDIQKIVEASADSDQDNADTTEQAQDNVAEVSVANKPHNTHEYIVVTQVGNYNFGIIVDRVFDTEEIVVKPVAQILRDIELFSGNTILGDGSVIMILDPNGIAKETGEIEDANDQESMAAVEAAEGTQKTSLLLFSAGQGSPKAVPLSLVARLENVDLSTIERSDDQMVVQYRGQLMPLVPFSHNVTVGTEGQKPVLVFSHCDNSMGLIVDEIIDITEVHIDVQLESSSANILGSAIINEQATDIIDVASFLQAFNKEWFKDHDDTPYGADGNVNNKRVGGKKKVLLVDDSPFFRNMLTPLLSVAGYEVTPLESPHAALKMCDEGREFDIIISDIEMPDMDGFEFAEKVRSNSNWQETPMVALSSHATPEDIDRGMEVGFSKYVAKFDRDILLSTLSQTLAEDKSNTKVVA
jgi:two-component system chemotaxis sensor kinase CheA